MELKKRGVIDSFVALTMMLIVPFLCYAQQSSGEEETRLEWSQDMEKTWIQLDEPISEGGKNKEWPWLPAEKFPFKAPYTGDELAWFLAHSGFVFGQYSETPFLSIRINKRGHLIQRSSGFRITQTHNWNEILDLNKLKPGESYYHQIQLYLEPPEKRGAGWIAFKYQENPQFTKYPDIWVYVPAIRRNRRVGITDKEDCISGSDQSWDDAIVRWPWQATHSIIGTDVLYEVAGVKQAVDSPDKYAWNPYREDGGMECYVVKEVNKDPDYYLSKKIVWYEKTTKLALRDEAYDRKGTLYRVTEITYFTDRAGGDYFSPQHHDKGLTQRLHHNAWTVDIDHRTWAPFSAEEINYKDPWSFKIYNPLQLLKEEFWSEETKVPYLNGPEDFIPRPPLYRDKFPKYRKIVLPGELEKKLESHK
ncbi:MAG: outer membrane lipoprotein-sorting protein [Thermodesulfobacteriota bacterium]|nr:outer membrane lipoprotein-sorting protein [Thermodesulfobacteriota bacterium]